MGESFLQTQEIRGVAVSELEFEGVWFVQATKKVGDNLAANVIAKTSLELLGCKGYPEEVKQGFRIQAVEELEAFIEKEK